MIICQSIQSLMKRHEKPEDYSRYSHIFHTEPKEKVFCPPHRRVRVEKSKIKVTVEDKNHSFSVRDNEIGRKITSEFIQVCYTYLCPVGLTSSRTICRKKGEFTSSRTIFFELLRPVGQF